MPQVIKDGSTGYTAAVDDHGRLYTLANMVGHLQHHSWWHQDAFMIPYNATITGTSEVPIAYFKNEDSSNDFEYYIVSVSCDAAATIRIYFDTTLTSGGEAVEAINMFRGSGITLSNVTTLQRGTSNDLIVDTSSATLGPTVYANARQLVPIDFQGALVFRNGRTATMTIETSDGAKVSVTALCSFHPVGTKL